MLLTTLSNDGIMMGASQLRAPLVPQTEHTSLDPITPCLIFPMLCLHERAHGDLVDHWNINTQKTRNKCQIKSKAISKAKASANAAEPKPSVFQRQTATGIKKSATSIF